MAGIPKIFISSTYFDLRQVREDLGRTVSDMGFEPMRSETNSFPIDPGLDTVENCRRVVEREADILVLIIGGRYGYVPEDSGKSVTNIEYLTARAKGIPVYVFIERSVLDILPVYKRNPSADFSGVVENPAVLDFISKIRDQDRVWTFAFDYAHEIAAVLRLQFAQRLGEALKVIAVMEGTDRAWMRSLSPAAFRLATEQPKAWEYLLFGQALIDAIEQHRDLRLRHRFRIAYGPVPVSDALELPDFLGRAAGESTRLAAAAMVLLNEALTEAVGAPGEPGDARMLAFVAAELAEVYRQALQWAGRVRCAVSIDGAEELVECLASFADSFVVPLEEFGPRILGEIRRGLLEGTPENPVMLNLTLTLESPPSEEFERLLQAFGQKLGLG
jgi:hypothetical protein